MRELIAILTERREGALLLAEKATVPGQALEASVQAETLEGVLETIGRITR